MQNLDPVLSFIKLTLDFKVLPWTLIFILIVHRIYDKSKES